MQTNSKGAHPPLVQCCSHLSPILEYLQDLLYSLLLLLLLHSVLRCIQFSLLSIDLLPLQCCNLRPLYNTQLIQHPLLLMGLVTHQLHPLFLLIPLLLGIQLRLCHPSNLCRTLILYSLRQRILDRLGVFNHLPALNRLQSLNRLQVSNRLRVLNCL